MRGVWKREARGGCLEIGYALFQVAQIVDARLQDGQLVHFLVAACGYHVLEDAKLLIHLRPPPTLDEAMGGFAGDLLAGNGGGGRLLFRSRVRRGRSGWSAFEGAGGG